MKQLSAISQSQRIEALLHYYNVSVQSAESRINCPDHGKHYFAYFLMPKGAGMARYECGHCINHVRKAAPDEV